MRLRWVGNVWSRCCVLGVIGIVQKQKWPYSVSFGTMLVKQGRDYSPAVVKCAGKASAFSSSSLREFSFQASYAGAPRTHTPPERSGDGRDKRELFAELGHPLECRGPSSCIEFLSSILF